MMKKICCIFVASLLVISMTIPMVFAGAQPQQTDQVTEEISSVEPVRAVISSFVYAPGSYQFGDFVFNYDYTWNMPNQAYTAYFISSWPQSALLTNSNPNLNASFVLFNDISDSVTITFCADYASFYYVDNVGSYSFSANTVYTITFTESIYLRVVTNGNLYYSFSADPQKATLMPVYNLLHSAGVNEEWSSIGVVIFAMLPIVTIWLIIGRVFKRKER